MQRGSSFKQATLKAIGPNGRPTSVQLYSAIFAVQYNAVPVAH